MNNTIDYIKKLSIDDAKKWMLFKENKLKLIEIWNELHPLIEAKNMGEILYCIRNNVSPLCKHDNHKIFKQFPSGYYTSCMIGKQCVCKSEMMRQKSLKASKNADKEKFKEHYKSTMLARYGVDNAFKLITHNEKTKNTRLQKYGSIDNYNDIIHSKKESTSIENWGVSHPRKNQDVVNLTKQTNLTRYGHTNPLQSEIIKNKIENTMIARYGVKNYFQSIENQNNIISNRRQTLGYDNPGQRWLSKETLEVLEDSDKFKDIIRNCSYEAAARKLGTSAFTISKYVQKYGFHDIISMGKGSVDQDEIAAWLESLGIRIITNTRNLISPFEIDIFLPDYNLAIEYNGIYYHCELSGNKSPTYHLEKYKKCRDNGIELIQICSTKYIQNPELIRSIILGRLGKHTRIMARNCESREISFNDSVKFLQENHLQSSTTTGSIRIGLIYDGSLVQLMTIGKSRKSLGAKTTEWELIRLCSNKHVTVTGGSSKLFSYFKKHYSPNNVISYLDPRYFKGTAMSHLGFREISISGPNYWYTNNYKQLYHRFNFTKYSLVKQGYDSNKTEWEIMQERGYDRLWDCGSIKYRWERDII